MKKQPSLLSFSCTYTAAPQHFPLSLMQGFSHIIPLHEISIQLPPLFICMHALNSSHTSFSFFSRAAAISSLCPCKITAALTLNSLYKLLFILLYNSLIARVKADRTAPPSLPSFYLHAVSTPLFSYATFPFLSCKAKAICFFLLYFPW